MSATATSFNFAHTVTERMDPMVRILTHSHVTALFVTESGSRYTLVARPNVGVVLINDTTGNAMQGDRVRVLNNRVYLIDDEGQILSNTTSVTFIDILTN